MINPGPPVAIIKDLVPGGAHAGRGKPAEGGGCRPPGGRDRKINRSISDSSSAEGLSRGHDVPSPPAFQGPGSGAAPGQPKPSKWRWRAAPQFRRWRPFLLPQSDPAGGSAAGWAGGLVSIRCCAGARLLAWSWHPAPVSQDTLPTPKNRGLLLLTPGCALHTPVRALELRRAGPDGRQRGGGESSGAASLALLSPGWLCSSPGCPWSLGTPEINVLSPVHPNPSLVQIPAAI